MRLALMLLLCHLATAQQPGDVRSRLSLWREANGISIDAKGIRPSTRDGEPADKSEASEEPERAASECQRAATWTIDADVWRRKLLISAQDAAEGVMHANDAELCQPHDRHLELESKEVLQVLELPVFVLNLPNKPDRRAHMLCLLNSLGFSNVEFPRVIERDKLRESQLSPYLVDLMRQSEGCNRYEPLSCLACCLSHLAAIELAVARQYDKFIVLEDDLILGGSVRSVRSRLAAAVAELPPSGDMLYLEACFEDCPKRAICRGLSARRQGPSALVRWWHLVHAERSQECAVPRQATLGLDRRHVLFSDRLSAPHRLHHDASDILSRLLLRLFASFSRRN